MYDEEDLLPLSALQHLAFCPRQCALMLLENEWDENHLTALGALLHSRPHEPDAEKEEEVLIFRTVPLRSLRLGLSGMADVVEFHPVCEGGMELPGHPGRWQPYPVEYKRGQPKPDICDEVQLCAQAMCLEEMLQLPVPRGALYYGVPRRRTLVDFSPDLRAHTERLAQQLHELINTGITPPAPRASKCRSCSLQNICLPPPRRRPRSAARYIQQIIDECCWPGETSEQ